MLRGVERRAQPADLAAVDRDDVEAAWRRRSEAAQIVHRGKDKPALLGRADARRRTAVPRIAARTDLDEHERAVGVAQNQVDFATAQARPGGDPIIALHQRQPLTQEVCEGLCLGRVAALLRLLSRHTFADTLVTTLDASLLRQAAQSAAGTQHFPTGALYVVATPIGNLADLSLRAIHVLGLADAIACEDTRHTAPLLRQLGIGDKPLLAVHEHNEHEAASAVLARLARGERVAYVSDAGTPAISDPGAALVAAAQAAGWRCVPVPGASSATTALSVAGDAGADGFVFIGFLPAKGAERQRAVAALAAAHAAQVLFEAPHRIESLATALGAACGERLVTVCRELTKQFETVVTLPAAGLEAWLAADANRARGEFVLVLHALPAPDAGAAELTAHDSMLQTLMAALPLKQAVAVAAELSGAARNRLYERALQLKRDTGDAEQG